MRYKLPPKNIDRIIEIDGFDKFELPLSSFAEKTDFLTWLDKNKTENPTRILEEVIRNSLPKELANVILDSGNMVFISEIYAQIVATKLGMSVEEYLKYSDKIQKQ